MRNNLNILHRRDFARIINERNYKTAIEIGGALCDYSDFLLTNTLIEKYYIIDPWDEAHGDYKIGRDGKHGFGLCQEKLSKHADRVILLHMSSDDAHSKIEDNSIDFIYVDGDHSFSCVINDLKNYWPKLKIGGILSGHDYDPQQKGVIDAVDTFAKENNLILYTTGIEFPDDFPNETLCGMEAKVPSWYFEKLK